MLVIARVTESVVQLGSASSLYLRSTVRTRVVALAIDTGAALSLVSSVRQVRLTRCIVTAQLEPLSGRVGEHLITALPLDAGLLASNVGPRVRMADHLVEHPVLLGLDQLFDALTVNETANDRLNLDETVVHLEEVLLV